MRAASAGRGTREGRGVSEAQAKYVEIRLRSNYNDEGCTAGVQEMEGGRAGDEYVCVACITVDATRSKKRALHRVFQVTGEWACRLFIERWA